jgi:hypothetical protein
MRRLAWVRPDSLPGGHLGIDLHGAGLFVQAAGQVIQLPAHVLAGQGEELARGRRSGLAQRLEQALDHGAEQLVGLQVQRRPGQSRVAAVEEGGAEVVESPDGLVEQGPDDRLGGCAGGQLVQVALDDDGGGLFGHGIPRG